MLLRRPKRQGTFRQLREWKRADQKRFFELEQHGLIERVGGASALDDQVYRLTARGVEAAELGEVELSIDVLSDIEWRVAAFQPLTKEQTRRSAVPPTGRKR